MLRIVAVLLRSIAAGAWVSVTDHGTNADWCGAIDRRLSSGPMPGAPPLPYHAVWGANASNVVPVGEGGIAHWNGELWRPVDGHAGHDLPCGLTCGGRRCRSP